MSGPGRIVNVSLDLACVSQAIEGTDTSALIEAIFQDLDPQSEDLSVRCLPGEYPHLVVEAALRAASTIEALRLVQGTVNRCLMSTGMFELFDVTGSDLRARPRGVTRS